MRLEGSFLSVSRIHLKNLNTNLIMIIQSFESTTKVFSQSRISNNIDYEKRSPIKKDFFNIEGSSKSEDTLKVSQKHTRTLFKYFIEN